MSVSSKGCWVGFKHYWQVCKVIRWTWGIIGWRWSVFGEWRIVGKCGGLLVVMEGYWWLWEVTTIPPPLIMLHPFQ